MTLTLLHDKRTRLKAGHGKKLLIMAVLFLAAFLLFQLNPYRLKLTKTQSVDYSVFLLTDSDGSRIERDQYIAILAPNNPSAGVEYVKQVVGLPGDEIKTQGRDVYVNGVLRGKAKTHSLKGRELEMISAGIIPEGFIYVFADHKDSYDSRYKEIGLVPLKLVTASARPVL
ncbi:MAG: S26 family signal peptidase [Maricaulaceae bacterium]